MTLSRRHMLMGMGGLGAAALATPETAWARAALAHGQAAAPGADWTLAVRDVQADVAPRLMRRVQGRMPDDLAGVLYRNGPALWRRPGGGSGHWFDGDGLIRRFALGDGQATLTARFADTPKRRLEARLGAMVQPGYGTAGTDQAEVGGPDDVNPANTSVMVAGEQVWALWEGGSPLALDGETLASDDFVTLRRDLAGMPFSAHPRYEPDGRVWNFGGGGDRAAIWRLAPDGTLEDFSLLELPRASYFHDFTMTASHLIFVLQPLILHRVTLPFAQSLSWQPELGTQVMVVAKSDLSDRRLYELPPLAFFHLGDGWQTPDGEIRFDGAFYETPALDADTGAAILRGEARAAPSARLGLAVLSPDGRGRVELADSRGEFPRSDPRRAGLERRFTVHASGDRDDRPLASAVTVTDWSRQSHASFDFGPSQVIEEMLWVPRPGRSTEAEAWLIGSSLNLEEGVTELHVLDAGRVQDGPVCSFRADVALPVGFHGAWRAG